MSNNITNNGTKEVTLYLYRTLVRTCNKFDKTPKYKQYFVTPKCLRPSLPTFFLPSVSFLQNLKTKFRESCNENNSNNDIISINHSLSNGFEVLKNLNLASKSYYESHSQQINSQLKNVYSKIGDLKNSNDQEHEIELTIKKPLNNNNNIPNKTSTIVSDNSNTTPITSTSTPPKSTTATTLNNNNNNKSNKKITKKEQIKLQKQQLLQKQNENKNKNFWPINEEEEYEDEEGNVMMAGKKIKPGTILIAHPSLGDTFSKKVVLITHVVDDRHYGFFINNPILTGPALSYINMELKTFDTFGSDLTSTAAAPTSTAANSNNVNLNSILSNKSKNFAKLYKYTLKRPLSALHRTSWNFGGPNSITEYNCLVPGIDGLGCSQVIHPYSTLPGSKKIRDGLYIGGKLKDIGERIKNKEIDPSKLLMFVGCSVWRPGQLEKEIKEGAWFKADCNNDLILKQLKTPDFWAEALNSMGGDYSDLVKSNF